MKGDERGATNNGSPGRGFGACPGIHGPAPEFIADFYPLTSIFSTNRIIRVETGLPDTVAG
jgi:hypothetical protein